MTLIASQAEIISYLGIAGTITESQRGLLTMLHTLAERAVQNFLGYNPTYQQHVAYLPPIGTREQDVPLSDYDYTAGSRVVPGRGRRGARHLQLKHLPVWETDLEVREDTGANCGAASGAFPASSVLTYGTDYWLDATEEMADVDSSSGELIRVSRSGILYRSGVWPSIARCVKATYYAGWRDDHFVDGPATDIKHSVILKAAKSYRDAQHKIRTQGGVITSESIGKYSVGYSTINESADPEIAMRLSSFRNYGMYF